MLKYRTFACFWEEKETLNLVENLIVAKHREFFQRFELNKEFAGLYSSVGKVPLKEIIEIAHHEVKRLFWTSPERHTQLKIELRYFKETREVQSEDGAEILCSKA